MEIYFPPLSCEWVDFSKSFTGLTCLSGWRTLLETEMDENQMCSWRMYIRPVHWVKSFPSMKADTWPKHCFLAIVCAMNKICSNLQSVNLYLLILFYVNRMKAFENQPKNVYRNNCLSDQIWLDSTLCFVLYCMKHLPRTAPRLENNVILTKIIAFMWLSHYFSKCKS